jgi:hypothetical protein
MFRAETKNGGGGVNFQLTNKVSLHTYCKGKSEAFPGQAMKAYGVWRYSSTQSNFDPR